MGLKWQSLYTPACWATGCKPPPREEWPLLGSSLPLTQTRKELTLELLTASSALDTISFLEWGSGQLISLSATVEKRKREEGWVGSWGGRVVLCGPKKAWPTTQGTCDHIWPEFFPMEWKRTDIYTPHNGCVTLGKTSPWVRSLSAAEKTRRSWQLEVVLWGQPPQLQQ